jgi:hypothetical protein
MGFSGFVYGIEHERGRVRVVHSLTSMGYPLGPVLGVYG